MANTSNAEFIKQNNADSSIFFDINPIRSYNRVLNFVVGARGIGKTFSFKEWGIRDFLATGNQFIYMRRFEKELINRKAKEGFFPRDLKEKFKDHLLEFKDGAYLCDGKICGYPMVLSKAGQEKGIIEYDNVTKVLFDEFIIDKRNYHYLPDETSIFKEAMVTIARMRFVQFFLMANATTWNNPYFIKYKIQRPTNDEEFIKSKSWVVQLPKQTEYKAIAEQSPLGKLFKDIDSEYFDYAYDNKLFRDNEDFLEKKTEESKPLFCFKFEGTRISIWYDFKDAIIYCSEKSLPEDFRTYVVAQSDHTEKTIMLFGTKPQLVKLFMDFFKNGRVRFETERVKGITYDIIRKLM